MLGLPCRDSAEALSKIPQNHEAMHISFLASRQVGRSETPLVRVEMRTITFHSIRQQAVKHPSVVRPEQIPAHRSSRSALDGQKLFAI